MRDKYLHKYREIGKRIAFYRQKRGMSQKDLAGIIQCSEEFINKIETYGLDISFANKSPWSTKSMKTLLAIADGLEVELLLFFLPITGENFEIYRTDK